MASYKNIKNHATVTTVLVTDVPPNLGFSGGLLTHFLCMNSEESVFAGFYILQPGLAQIRSQLPLSKEITAQYCIKKLERTWRPRWVPKRLSFLFSFARELIRKHFECRKFARQIEKFARSQNTDRVWIILQGQTLIWTAENIIRRGHLKVRVQYWDQPSWWGVANELDRLSKRMLNKSFEYCLANSTMAGVPSDTAAKLHSIAGVRSVPLFSSVRPRPDLPAIFTQPTIKIGIAGQLYADDTIYYLLFALDFARWKLNGRPVEIHHWGPSCYPKIDPYLKKRGYVDQSKLVYALGECDILYCPYWFVPSFQNICQTSSPSKIATYMAAKRPILFHGPDYSSMVPILREYDAAELCHSIGPEAVLFHLRRCLDVDLTGPKVIRAAMLLEEQLSPHRVNSNFSEFINA